jgi:hypothetical protein
MRIDLTIFDRRPQKSVSAALGPSNTGNFDIAMDGLGLSEADSVWGKRVGKWVFEHGFYLYK